MKNCSLKIFTDGSANPDFNLGAWASIILYNNEKTILTGVSKDTTHQRMELLAVIKSIEFIDEKFAGSSMEIYTDSQYVVRMTDRMDKLLRTNFITKKGDLLHNSDLVEILIRQIRSHNIEFIKVKAHQKSENDKAYEHFFSAVNYNIEVDKLVRKILRESVLSES